MNEIYFSMPIGRSLFFLNHELASFRKKQDDLCHFASEVNVSLDICIVKQDMNTEKEQGFCSLIVRYNKIYFHILVVGSKGIQAF